MSSFTEEDYSVTISHGSTTKGRTAFDVTIRKSIGSPVIFNRRVVAQDLLEAEEIVYKLFKKAGH